MATWQIRPTSRRTSATDRVDIHDDAGRLVADYVLRADALRMIHDPMTVAEDAIELYIEGLDRRDGEHEAARRDALAEIATVCTTDPLPF